MKISTAKSRKEREGMLFFADLRALCGGYLHISHDLWPRPHERYDQCADKQSTCMFEHAIDPARCTPRFGIDLFALSIVTIWVEPLSGKNNPAILRYLRA